MSRSTSSAVSPVATHPGRSGTYAAKFVPASSMTIAYRLITPPPSIRPAGLFEDAGERPRRHGVTRLSRDVAPAGLGRVLELSVAALGLDSHPAVGAEPPQYLTHLHNTRRLPG